ncbi:MAG: Coenzyme F420 hydrogenase/dehydrogenase, beta subunit C-terminal domain [Anaerolineaceae bacterium]|nr:Coenzyme F420 hydrogenase/dehydrogenase, beta subunit C-terminal domain [Anaerolineaceae bacterium]
MRKAQTIDKRLNEKVAFCIGLYCGGRPTIMGQKFAFERYGIDLAEVEKIKYRQPEWPGHLLVTLKSGEEIHVHKPEQLQGFSGQIFGHPRCILCHDATADLADISTGDAIRLEDFKEPEEKSIVVARTKTGLDLLESARLANILNLREVGIDKFVHSQHRPILHKKLALWARMKIANRLLGMHPPQITMTTPENELKLRSVYYFAGLRILLVSRLVSNPFIRKLLRIVPMSWLKKYSNFEIYS